MSQFDYKEALRVLRLIAGKAIDMKNNGLVEESDIEPILRYEELVEEIITKSYIYEAE